MALTRPIPVKAMPIVMLIRHKVNPPTEGEITDWGHIRLCREGETWCGYCPIGFLLGSAHPAPVLPVVIRAELKSINGRVLGRRSLEKFINWWDEQQDVKAAVEAVWPKENR